MAEDLGVIAAFEEIETSKFNNEMAKANSNIAICELMIKYNGSAGDPAQVYRERVHRSRWESTSRQG